MAQAAELALPSHGRSRRRGSSALTSYDLMSFTEANRLVMRRELRLAIVGQG
ncbi:MAG: hypothetical protein QOF26_832, partial [Baekduia sp.]|nr:hypothetical protein [Baekduia sp.]